MCASLKIVKPCAGSKWAGPQASTGLAGSALAGPQASTGRAGPALAIQL